MARGLRGSSRDKAQAAQFSRAVSGSPRTRALSTGSSGSVKNILGAINDWRSEKMGRKAAEKGQSNEAKDFQEDNEPETETLTRTHTPHTPPEPPFGKDESMQIVGGAEGGVSDKPPAPLRLQDSAASELISNPDQVKVQASAEVNIDFKKVPTGGSVLVEMTRSDNKQQTTMTFHSHRGADEFIANKKKELEGARAARENGTAVPKLPKVSASLTKEDNGDMTITAAHSKQTVVVVPEMQEAVVKWLNGRGVAAHGVSERGLTLVTDPCGQKATFQLHLDGRVTVAR